MGTRIAINGFGRIGRCVARILFGSGQSELELVGINDLTDAETLAHLLAFDSVHGRWDKPVAVDGSALVIDGKKVPITAEKDPTSLPWKEQEVDIVLECTGVFRSKEKASGHLDAGAKRVIISAPGGADVDGTFCYGINSDAYDPQKHVVISNASCTTNCLAPLVKVLHDELGVEKAHMVTVHSYTNDQRILDLPHKDLRRARAAAVSMIPTTTGAAKAIGLVIPELDGKLDGTAIRVPTEDVSITCLTAQVKRKTDREAVNAAFEKAAAGPLKGVLHFEPRPLVSRDYIGDSHSCVLDAAQTQVVEGDLVEVQGWYDNEWGFSHRMVDMAKLVARKA
ncbi:MAG: type I glyceraldehyde-3-phosphate dehydrogenase [Myxococcota bacterium]